MYFSELKTSQMKHQNKPIFGKTVLGVRPKTLALIYEYGLAANAVVTGKKLLAKM